MLTAAETSLPGLCDLVTTARRAGPRAELKCKLDTAVRSIRGQSVAEIKKK